MSDDATYQPDDFVYVDPRERVVIGLVEWDKNGLPKARAYEIEEKLEKTEGGDKAKRQPRKRKGFYPWGTYRSMNRIYRIERKPKVIESGKTLDEILPKALTDAFWNN